MFWNKASITYFASVHYSTSKSNGFHETFLPVREQKTNLPNQFLTEGYFWFLFEMQQGIHHLLRGWVFTREKYIPLSPTGSDLDPRCLQHWVTRLRNIMSMDFLLLFTFF